MSDLQLQTSRPTGYVEMPQREYVLWIVRDRVTLAVDCCDHYEWDSATTPCVCFESSAEAQLDSLGGKRMGTW